MKTETIGRSYHLKNQIEVIITKYLNENLNISFMFRSDRQTMLILDLFISLDNMKRNDFHIL
jgi:hypothetical protein